MINSERMPTESEFLEWQLHPATKRLFAWARNWREENKEQWGQGDFIDETDFKTRALNIAGVAQCKVLEAIVNIEYEQLLGESDGKQQRTEAPRSSSPG